MLTLAMYAVCLLLAFKGVEIFQQAMIATELFRSWRLAVITIGICSVLFAVSAAIFLALLFTKLGMELDQGLREMQTPQYRPPSY